MTRVLVALGVLAAFGERPVWGPGTRHFSEALMTAGVRHVYVESPGTAHEWLTWRRALNDVAPRLFK